MSSVIQETGRDRARNRGWLSRLVNLAKIWKLDRSDMSYARRAREMGPTIRDRQQELVRFYSHYEDLVGTLIDLAQVGPTPSLENRYQAMRTWMIANYGTVRQHAVVYLKYDTNDAQHSMDICGKPADAFEALFAAESLHQFLRFDDGLMINRSARPREPLNLYGHHLRLLASNS